jgi:excisionase family DNA binding protein
MPSGLVAGIFRASQGRAENRIMSPKPSDTEPLVVRPREAARLLAVGNTTLYKLIAAGEIASYVVGRSRRIPLASIKGYIARHLADGASSTKRKRGRPRKNPPQPGAQPEAAA